MTYLIGSFVSFRISVSSSLLDSVPRLPLASKVRSVSTTATPSPPITNPALAAIGAFAFGLGRATHTSGPICFRRNDVSIESCAAAFAVLKSTAQNRRRSVRRASFVIFSGIGLSSSRSNTPQALKVFENAGKVLEKVLKNDGGRRK